MRYAKVAAVVAALFFSVYPLRAQTPSTAAPSAENLAAARELVAAMRATDQFKVVLPAIVEGMKPAVVQGRPQVAKDFDAIMPIIVNGAMQRVNELAEMLAVIYARNFSVDEIHDLIAFYKTPTGQKLLERQATIARESMAAGQQFGQGLVQDIRQQIDDELKKRGDSN
ncbi:MAG TPA: DUF2059 domain-containing protein [Xanthobacteraceae bacterium]|nr:DUF2059 domain-containing protein [Xanthobacteraceae bacterium]